MEPSMRENKHTKVHVALVNGTDHGRDCTSSGQLAINLVSTVMLTLVPFRGCRSFHLPRTHHGAKLAAAECSSVQKSQRFLWEQPWWAVDGMASLLLSSPSP